MADDIKKKATLQGEILRKAMTDDSFRQQLTSNPKPAIEKELGIKLPDNLNIKVLEQSSDTFYLILPRKSSSEELSEEELGQVAGGWGHVHICVCTKCSEYTSFDPNCTPDC